ncbi:MAG: RDD family protein [Candidatus Hydrogenedentes bacterium]|nr:RDD family protein [Candidatus Hydrogenedentota bacterium]
MNWHYAAKNGQHGPVDQATFEALIQSGEISADTLVWNSDLPDWKPLSALPDITGAAQHPKILVTCAECGAPAPLPESLRFVGDSVCAACKGYFFQRLFQGTPRPSEKTPASIGRRFLAVMLDQVLAGCVNLLVGISLASMALSDETWLVTFYYAFTLVLGVALALAYEIWFLGRFGATPGKMIFGMRVIVSDGSRVSYLRAAGRYFARYLSGMILLIGFLLAFYDPRHRALHDRICETLVIQE